MDCKVIERGRRCLRLATMRLPYMFLFLLLFSAGGLLLLLHLQYLTETLHEQAPGSWWAWSLSQETYGTRQGTPWTGCYSITGRTHYGQFGNTN